MWIFRASTAAELTSWLRTQPKAAFLIERFEGLQPDNALLERLRAISVRDAARLYESLLSFELTPPSSTAGWRALPSTSRRRGGSHFTPPALAAILVEQCLRPCLARAISSDQLLALRVCDPAVGAGVFLNAVQNQLSDALLERWFVEGRSAEPAAARSLVTENCLFGSDIDRLALWLASLALDPCVTSTRLDRHLIHGDALLEPELDADALSNPSEGGAVDFRGQLPEVFNREPGGFDAIIGNPPWVAYVGRAAQPLAPARSRYFVTRYRGFHKYRTLHGLFLERCTELLRPSGRLGLLLPTSIADLAGYAPARAAHDALCQVDVELPDFEDGGFEDIFQPCIGLLSTRRSPSVVSTETTLGAAWKLSRRDLDGPSRALIERLRERPVCPAALFRERGYQTSARDREKLRSAPSPAPEDRLLYTGSEVLEFQRLNARFCVDPSELCQPFRDAEEWRDVALWLRQTARYPIVTLGDGQAFRNSVIAGFEIAPFTRFLLLAYLNSTAVRWFHFHTQRDARQGMPQLKVAHLRSLPAPPAESTLLGKALHELGHQVGLRNQGIRATERERLDALMAQIWELTPAEASNIAAWGLQNPPPLSRALKRSQKGLKPVPPSRA